MLAESLPLKDRSDSASRVSFTKPQSQHKHHQTHTWASPQTSKNATGIIQHPFNTKAKETKLNYLNTFGHSMTTTNLSPSRGESLSSANLITVLASNKCNLCLFEKYVIICKKNLCSLNKRNELASSCPHRTRYLLKNFVVK